MPSFLLQPRWRSQRFVSRRRLLCSGTTEAVASLWKILEKRFEVKQAGRIGFFAGDAKELKILNRAIKIDDEMTLEADTKLIDEALESMKLSGAKGVDSPRVRRNEEENNTD